MVFVPAGPFEMGNNFGPDDEKPAHTVTLDAFWIDRTEVTNAIYARRVQADICQSPSEKSSSTRNSYYGNSRYADYPVVNVSWNDAKRYCAWAGRRLPTEAEWEKAARGTDGRVYPWGDSAPSSERLNFSVNLGDTTPVGLYPEGASPYGALDMAGNVLEWVADWYAADYYWNSPDQNPEGPESSDIRVLRGGAWGFVEDTDRTTARFMYEQSGISINRFGFRCALSP